MSYAADSAIDFVSIARELGVTPGQPVNKTQSNGSELVPTEVRSRMQREGSTFLQRPNVNGTTIDREGLTNNYAVEPEMYYAAFPSPEQARQYVWQGAVAALLVVSVFITSVAVS